MEDRVELVYLKTLSRCIMGILGLRLTMFGFVESLYFFISVSDVKNLTVKVHSVTLQTREHKDNKTTGWFF